MPATIAAMPLSDTVAWARIASAYTVVEPSEVRRFIAEHAGAADALLEGREALRVEFGSAPVRLSVEREPDERDGALLFATVETDATVDEAQRRLRRLDAVWQAALPAGGPQRDLSRCQVRLLIRFAICILHFAIREFAGGASNARLEHGAGDQSRARPRDEA